MTEPGRGGRTLSATATDPDERPFLTPLTGAGGFRDRDPSAYALGYVLAPLRD
jgi:hypothetical protein